MKEKLKNSLQVLSDEVENLSEAVSFYRESANRRILEQAELAKLRETSVRENLEQRCRQEVESLQDRMGMVSKNVEQEWRAKVESLQARERVWQENTQRLKQSFDVRLAEELELAKSASGVLDNEVRDLKSLVHDLQEQLSQAEDKNVRVKDGLKALKINLKNKLNEL